MLQPLDRQCFTKRHQQDTRNHHGDVTVLQTCQFVRADFNISENAKHSECSQLTWKASFRVECDNILAEKTLSVEISWLVPKIQSCDTPLCFYNIHIL